MASSRKSALVPYVVVGFAWFAFLVVVSRVRTVEPIFLWVLTQELLLEKLLPLGGRAQWLVLFAVYVGAGVIAWAIIERPWRDASHVWRRAMWSWFGLQAVYCAAATALVQFGILYE